MKFIRLHDPLLTVLFEDDDIIAINKPYGFNAHTNDSKIEHSEFIQDGLIEIYEKQRKCKLHIIHRLDQTTTGVMIFGKSVESAKKYAEYFFNRQVKKTYFFVTKSKSTEKFFLIDQMIVHKAKDLDAKTELRFVSRSSAHELWQANPLTGRNHQIRIHAQAAGLSILGDDKYEGAHFPFLCLHNQRIEFPNGIVITAKPPVYFENLDFLSDSFLAQCLFQIDRRLRIYGEQPHQSFRLIHNRNNPQVPGFTLDQLGTNLVLQWYFDHWTDIEQKRFTELSRLLKKPVIVRLLSSKLLNEKKNFIITTNSNSDSLPESFLTVEGRLTFSLRSDSGASTGLLLNQRLHRRWLTETVKDKSVLALFSSTGASSVAAAAGGALQVTSVDSSKNNLNWSRQNFELNQLTGDSFLFFCRDSITFLQQALIKKNKYDVILCDAPSFYRREKGVFKIEQDLQLLLRNALQCLSDQGQILLSTTYDEFYIDTVRQIIYKTLSDLKINAEISCVLPSLDFELPNEKANLKSFLIQKNPFNSTKI